MSTILTPDLCVVGAGSAGLSLTAAARALGLSVVLIERGRMGGECLNTGCVPSKALLAAARHAAAVRRAAAFGVRAGEPTVDPDRVHAHVRAVIDAIAPHDSQERFTRLGATVIRSEARFLDAATLEADGRRIRARRFVLATGSRPRIPDLQGLSGVSYLTNESLFDVARLPRHLVVLGGGPIGLEMAQAFRRLGSEVTVLQRGRLLPADDPELVEVVAARLAAEGIRLRAGVAVTAAEADGTEVTLRLADGTRVSGSDLLVATGRRPTVDGLELERAGIAVDARGIRVDGAMRTDNPRVFAIGDAVGTFRFTHWASHQAALVLRTILTHRPARENPAAVVWATYTDPEIARAGLDEAAARERFGRAVGVHRARFADNDRARAEGETDGLVKLVVGRGGRILGAGLAGPSAGETAGLVAVAVAARMSAARLADTVLPYPTLAESVRRAALASRAGALERPLVKGVLALARRFV